MLLEKAVTPNCKAGTWLMPPLATPGCPSVAVGHPNPQSALLQVILVILLVTHLRVLLGYGYRISEFC